MKQGESPSQPIKIDYQKQLRKSIARFQQALNGYERATSQEMTRIQTILTEEMPLIVAAAKEIKLLGAEKQAVIVHGEFERFIKDPSKENFTALQQDMVTLNEFGKQP
jgi:hypothetical protein